MKTNTGNLEQICERSGFGSPYYISLEEAELGKLACLKKLKDIESQAPQKRLEHLQSCLAKARKRGDKDKEQAIVRILWRECDMKRCCRMRSAFGKPRGNLTSRLATCAPEGKKDPVFTTREKVEKMGAESLKERFTTAHSSSIYSGQLLDDIG